jgi:hypothetical protein
MTVLASPSSHPTHLRKERVMQFAEQRLQQVQAQQAEFRAQRQAERLAFAEAAERAERRTVRREVGQRLIRLGERVAGDALRSPVVTG